MKLIPGWSKKLWRRIHWWYAWFIILLLIDEYIKEGYLIKPSDFLEPLTHENIMLLATLTYITINAIGIIRRWKHDRDNS